MSISILDLIEREPQVTNKYRFQLSLVESVSLSNNSDPRAFTEVPTACSLTVKMHDGTKFVFDSGEKYRWKENKYFIVGDDR